MRIRFSLLSLFAFVALSGCSSVAEPASHSAVTITNASAVALTDVHVGTGPDDDLSDAIIAPGATTALRSVHAVYGDIHVTARIGNQSVSVLPLEGFVGGLNTRFPDGTYAVVLTAHLESDGTYWLEASVTPRWSA